MKNRALVLTFVCVAAALAGAAQRAGAAQPARDTTVSCEDAYQGRLFRMDLQPHRYVMVTEIDLNSPSDELMRAFQEPGEERLQVSSSALHLELDPGSCTLATANRAHFIECPLATNGSLRGVNASRVHFTAEGTSALGSRQSTAIGRDLELVNVTIHADVQRKVGSLGPEDRVMALITVRALVGGQTRTLRLTKDLGEWTAKKDRSNFDRCVVTP